MNRIVIRYILFALFLTMQTNAFAQHEMKRKGIISPLSTGPTPSVLISSKEDSVDKVMLRIQYHVEYKEAIEDKIRKKDVQVLDIGQNMVAYYRNPLVYSFDHLSPNLLQAASVNKDTLSKANRLAFSKSRIYGYPYSFLIYRNYPQEGIQSCCYSLTPGGIMVSGNNSVGNFDFYYTEPLNTPQWQLLSADSTVCDYPCHKAQTDFCGRRWTVWYSEELPYQEGPWKLCGLPGIILKAEDSKGEYCFNAIEVLQPSDRIIASPEMEKFYHKSTRKRVYETMVMSFKNPVAMMSQMFGEAIVEAMQQDMGFQNDDRTPCILEIGE